MIRKLLKRIMKPLWDRYWYKLSQSLHGPVQTQRHRNDEELEWKARLDDPLYLERFGFKVFSQGDEDGMIEEIFNRVHATNRTFVEFGVGNGIECNTHFLLHKGWKGLWIEGNIKEVDEIRKLFNKPIEDKRLSVVNAFITKDNINTLIKDEGEISGEIDLLSIDIDGNDYWVWEAIRCVNPRVVVIEYNAKFPPTHEWVMEYNASHIWCGDDLHGASLKSLERLGAKLGYQLVGTNVLGVNAFFVRGDLSNDLFVKPAIAEKLYNPTRWLMKYISGHYSKAYIGK